jgi:hypothetical protein
MKIGKRQVLETIKRGARKVLVTMKSVRSKAKGNRRERI